jgi:menaquinone-dependent protoporphyrinogen oxidase
MKPFLVIYATREGHTRHIAEDLGATLGARGLSFEVFDAARLPEEFVLGRYEAAIISASLHLGKHEPEIAKFVKGNLAELQQIPTLFLSVSLAELTVEDANSPPEERIKARAAVKQTIDNFLGETGWHPSHVGAVAGALMYSRYNFLIRFVMRRIARKAGAPVDTSRDYEFTDWTKLHRLVEEFVQAIPSKEDDLCPTPGRS